MYRYKHRKAGSYWPQCLPNRSVRLIDTQYFTLLFLFNIIGNNSVQHGVAQAVK